MSIGVLLGILLSVVLVNNLVLAGFLGICPFLGVSRKVGMAFGMGCAVTFVITVSGVVTWLIVHAVLMPIGDYFGRPDMLYFLKYVAFIMVIASMVQLVEMYLKKFSPPLYTAFGVFLPLITTNCAILGACLYIDMKSETQNLLNAAVYALGGGIGFTLAITIMAGIREHIQFSDVPKCLRGAGITLLVAGILAMAFTGFTGIGK
ncbi:MAG TPA: Rnf-Nqr domain containing protein [Phycisphaerae bacterium]|nr:Rnf-Nqr domain containing protein [Phycisphaerae bacterium]HNU44281.1 Rnf-Nqr domain containing protein [Phycisphaerae bacterium]